MQTEFAVFANGTFWGVWTADTAQDAMQAAADDMGTDGNTDGLVALPADDYARSTILKAIEYAGREEVLDAIVQWNNTTENDISEEGDVWVANPQAGHWLNTERMVKFARFLDQ